MSQGLRNIGRFAFCLAMKTTCRMARPAVGVRRQRLRSVAGGVEEPRRREDGGDLPGEPRQGRAISADGAVGRGVRVQAGALGHSRQAGRGLDGIRRPHCKVKNKLRLEEVLAYRDCYGLGSRARRDLGTADIVVANILGPLLVRFAEEIAPCAAGDLVVSGILSELYPEVLAAYAARGFAEVSRKTLGEWTTGRLRRRH